jgi:hypothetical protein
MGFTVMSNGEWSRVILWSSGFLWVSGLLGNQQKWPINAEAEIRVAEYRILKNNYSFVGAHANFA